MGLSSSIRTFKELLKQKRRPENSNTIVLRTISFDTASNLTDPKNIFQNDKAYNHIGSFTSKCTEYQHTLLKSLNYYRRPLLAV